jgi:hypothetical protein
MRTTLCALYLWEPHLCRQIRFNFRQHIILMRFDWLNNLYNQSKLLIQNVLYLLYDDSGRGHYDVIGSITGAMCRKYVCNSCDKLYDFTHTCDKTCALFTAVPPCTQDQTKYCGTCNRTFVSAECFENHKTLEVRGKWKSICKICSFTETGVRRVTFHRLVVLWTEYAHVCGQWHGRSHRPKQNTRTSYGEGIEKKIQKGRRRLGRHCSFNRTICFFKKTECDRRMSKRCMQHGNMH